VFVMICVMITSINAAVRVFVFIISLGVRSLIIIRQWRYKIMSEPILEVFSDYV
jgi:hypothetical protein